MLQLKISDAASKDPHPATKIKDPMIWLSQINKYKKKNQASALSSRKVTIPLKKKTKKHRLCYLYKVKKRGEKVKLFE